MLEISTGIFNVAFCKVGLCPVLHAVHVEASDDLEQARGRRGDVRDLPPPSRHFLVLPGFPWVGGVGGAGV